MKIKNILTLATLALSVSSCTKSELTGSAPGNSGAIDYSLYAARPTKAAILDNTNFTSFQVYSYSQTEVSGTPGAFNFAAYYNEAVTKDGTSGKWAGLMPRRWPNGTNDYLNFYAYSDPANVTNYVAATSGTAHPSFTYTIGAAADQRDLLVSGATQRSERSNQGKLTLDFKHALTQIGLKAKSVSPAFKVIVKSVTFKGVNSVGTFTYDGTSTVTGSWSGATTPVDYTFTVESPSTLDNVTAGDLASADGNLMLLPTADPSAIEVRVVYDVMKLDGTTAIATALEKKIKLAAETTSADVATVTPWKMGKKITYTLILTGPQNEILFGDVTLDEWDTESESAIEGKDIFDISNLYLPAFGNAGLKVIVGDDRPTAGAFTLKSDQSWVKFSRSANDAAGAQTTLTVSDPATKATAAGTEVYIYATTYNSDVPATRKAIITLERAGYDSYTLAAEQPAVAANPLKNCTWPEFVGGVAQVVKVDGLLALKTNGITHRLTAGADWYTLSTDGIGDGAKEITFEGDDAPMPFYVHLKENTSLTSNLLERTANLSYESENKAGEKQTKTLAIKQVPDHYLGNFAGTLKSDVVDGKTRYYYDKLLFMTVTTSVQMKWGPDSDTGVRDKWDGKGNTAKLVAMGPDYLTANHCAQRAPVGTYYVPAIRQAQCLLYSFPLSSAIATSTEASSSIMSSFTQASGKSVKATPWSLRCVREVEANGTVALAVVKDADGTVYIDAEGLVAVGEATTTSQIRIGGFSDRSANTPYKKLQIAKNDGAGTLTWVQATGLPNSYYDTANAAGRTQGEVNTGCVAYSEPGAPAGSWRVPTYREMLLMWQMKEALTQVGIASLTLNTYWTSSQGNDNQGIMITCGDDGDYYFIDKATTLRFRCVRELN